MQSVDCYKTCPWKVSAAPEEPARRAASRLSRCIQCCMDGHSLW